ncbi:hypothetical protein [Sinobaca sp. H24]|uniref:hypothetical protein n=1 Tax=Sinobaca sp. H24 TaxID=2923376 RepID=UPI0035B221D6
MQKLKNFAEDASRLFITEIPYDVVKSNLVKKMDEIRLIKKSTVSLKSGMIRIEQDSVL